MPRRSLWVAPENCDDERTLLPAAHKCLLSPEDPPRPPCRRAPHPHPPSPPLCRRPRTQLVARRLLCLSSSFSSSSTPTSDSYTFEAEAETLQFDSTTAWPDDGPATEIRARGLDMCGGQLGLPMVQGYMKAAVPYCELRDTSAASITYFPARAPSSPNNWWPYPQAFCAAHHLAHTPGWGSPMQDRGLFTGPCALTHAGRTLKDAMGRETFLGTEFIDALLAAEGGRSKNGGGGDKGCAENVTHPVLFVPRQDRWNPFHVGEDLVTTFLALTLFSLTPPPPPPPAGGLGSWFFGPASAGTEASATNAHLLAALPETYFALGLKSEVSNRVFGRIKCIIIL
ncbi:hypothetical protein C8F04DRAFT_1323179 [Mycena alexandri]|uniref:Uncharacterized protein n=1 Tax=Mycena alexandri TaxID=1745969 RepID=A0AAD6XBI1_9AGAR|nr:hypothetical protein C8F04DRAFT_1323179 [Mycena alexandri]